MAIIRMDGMAELADSFGALSDLPDGVVDDMLRAEADVLVAAQKQTAGTILSGAYSKGGVAGSITRDGKMKRVDGLPTINIIFKGSLQDAHHKKPTRYAQIAYVNEYGKRNQPARPFIRTANEQKADEAAAAAAAAMDKYLRSNNL